MLIEAGPRGSTHLQNASEISNVIELYLPRGNKSPNKSGLQVRQPPTSTNPVIRIYWPTNLVISAMAQSSVDDSSSGDCSWKILEPLIPCYSIYIGI